MSYMSELDAATRQEYLSDVSTKELVDELAKREGIKEIVCPDPGHHYEVHVSDEEGKPKKEGVCGCRDSGPAIILVVID